MGIIAGIAVPVTIAVINRQKKNAAAKSAEAVVATIKQLTQEYLAQSTGSIVITLAYGSTDVNTPTTATVNYAGTDIDWEETDFTVENLKAQGTITSSYNTQTAVYTFTTNTNQFKVNGYNISVAADGTATASSAS